MRAGTSPPRNRGGVILSCIALVVVLGQLAQQSAFLQVPKQELQRRHMAAAIASQVLLAPQTALARDRQAMVIGARKRLLPRMLKYYKELKAAGKVTDDLLDPAELDKFISTLVRYGNVQDLTESVGPDKIARKLAADAKEVETYLMSKDYKKAMEALEVYRKDIPDAGGMFQWTDVV